MYWISPWWFDPNNRNSVMPPRNYIALFLFWLWYPVKLRWFNISITVNVELYAIDLISENADKTNELQKWPFLVTVGSTMSQRLIPCNCWLSAFSYVKWCEEISTTITQKWDYTRALIHLSHLSLCNRNPEGCLFRLLIRAPYRGQLETLDAALFDFNLVKRYRSQYSINIYA